MQRADPTIVAQEHVVGADTRIVAPVDDGPLDHEVDVRGMRQVVWTYIDNIPKFVAQHDVEVVRVGGNRRAGNLLQRLTLLVVDLPELMRHHFESDWVDLVALVVREDLQLRRDRAELGALSFRVEVLGTRDLQNCFCHD